MLLTFLAMWLQIWHFDSWSSKAEWPCHPSFELSRIIQKMLVTCKLPPGNLIGSASKEELISRFQEVLYTENEETRLIWSSLLSQQATHEIIVT